MPNFVEMALGVFFPRSPYLGVPLVIGSEAFVMWCLGWGTGQRCLVDALIMNLLGIFPAWAGMWIVALASGRILHRFHLARWPCCFLVCLLFRRKHGCSR